jgi:hypothetical protein
MYRLFLEVIVGLCAAALLVATLAACGSGSTPTQQQTVVAQGVMPKQWGQSVPGCYGWWAVRYFEPGPEVSPQSCNAG